MSSVISFTGSTAVGSSSTRTPRRSSRRSHLEMGGKNVIMVMDDADLDSRSKAACGAPSALRAALHRGQPRDRAQEGSRAIRRRLRRARRGAAGRRRPRSATQMGPSISETQLQKVMSYVEIGKQEGAKSRAAASADPGDSQRILPRADRLHRRRRRRCASRRKRSSGRSYR